MRNGKTKQQKRLGTRVISSKSIGVRPFLDDLREMTRLCEKSKQETVTELARTLIHEALRARRLREISNDEGNAGLFKKDRQLIAEALTPLREELSELRRFTAESLVQTPLLDAIKTTQTTLTDLTKLTAQEERKGQVMQALYTLIVQALGYSMLAERETRLLVENELEARRKSPEEVKKLLAQLEEQSHRETDDAVFKILREHRLVE